MDLRQLIAALEAQIGNPRQGLPDEVFQFVSRLTPMINVDLLVKNSENETLLTWRDDAYYGPGWHVPGGIVRFKEPLANRIEIVARKELGTSVTFDPAPLAVNELMAAGRDTRGHFISLLYACCLAGQPDPSLACRSDGPRNGEWAWHAVCPANLIGQHEVYRKYIG